MSMLAYGWVERCSDVAGCGVSSSSKDKYSWLFHLCNYIYYFMNYDEHVECLNVYVCFCWMLSNHASLYDGLCVLVCIMFKLLFQHWYLFMFMGLFAHMIGVSSVLFARRRVGDVTEWYQSKGCSMGLNGPWRCSDRAYVAAIGPQRAMKEQVTKAGCLLPRRNRRKFQKKILSLKIIGWARQKSTRCTTDRT